MIDFIYSDSDIIVCIKPAGVLSTDEPGGMPELVREALGDPEADVRTVHRLDRVAGGLMVLARTPQAASELSRQIRQGEFQKSYLAVVHGAPRPEKGRYTDLLARSKEERKTYVAKKASKETRQAVLDYETLAGADGLSLVKIELVTGRTHQIRCQFSSRGMPLAGDRKYSTLPDDCPLALWSCSLRFRHPASGLDMSFEAPPPDAYPWNTLK